MKTIKLDNPPLAGILRLAPRVTKTLLLMALTQPPVAYGDGSAAKPGMQGDMKHMDMRGMDRPNMDGMDMGDMPAGNASAGATLANEVCSACHGPGGMNTSDQYPQLAGQHEMYLARALAAYRSKARKAELMNAVAARLTDQDIANLAAYFAASRPNWSARP